MYAIIRTECITKFVRRCLSLIAGGNELICADTLYRVSLILKRDYTAKKHFNRAEHFLLKTSCRS